MYCLELGLDRHLARSTLRENGRGGLDHLTAERNVYHISSIILWICLVGFPTKLAASLCENTVEPRLIGV